MPSTSRLPSPHLLSSSTAPPSPCQLYLRATHTHLLDCCLINDVLFHPSWQRQHSYTSCLNSSYRRNAYLWLCPSLSLPLPSPPLPPLLPPLLVVYSTTYTHFLDCHSFNDVLCHPTHVPDKSQHSVHKLLDLLVQSHCLPLVMPSTSPPHLPSPPLLFHPPPSLAKCIHVLPALRTAVWSMIFSELPSFLLTTYSFTQALYRSLGKVSMLSSGLCCHLFPYPLLYLICYLHPPSGLLFDRWCSLPSFLTKTAFLYKLLDRLARWQCLPLGWNWSGEYWGKVASRASTSISP